MTERIRKQVYDLVPADLEAFAVWELALDEEGEEGQDEATARPNLREVDPADGLFVVRAELLAADGTRFDGYLSPHAEPDLAFLQPTVVTPERQVGFWFGVRAPTAEALAEAYGALGTTPDRLFPLRFRALVACRGVSEGTIEGFSHLVSARSREVVTTR
jgi:hypothetical protein